MVLALLPPLAYLCQTEFSVLLDLWIKTLKYYATSAEKCTLIDFSMTVRRAKSKDEIMNVTKSCLKQLLKLKNKREQKKRKYFLEGIVVAEVLRMCIISNFSNPQLLNVTMNQALAMHPELFDLLEEATQDQRDSRDSFLQFLLTSIVNDSEKMLFGKLKKTVLMIAFGLLEERSAYYQSGSRASDRTKRRDRAFQVIFGVIVARRNRMSRSNTIAVSAANPITQHNYNAALTAAALMDNNNHFLLASSSSSPSLSSAAVNELMQWQNASQVARAAEQDPMEIATTEMFDDVLDCLPINDSDTVCSELIDDNLGYFDEDALFVPAPQTASV